MKNSHYFFYGYCLKNNFTRYYIKNAIKSVSFRKHLFSFDEYKVI